MTSPECPRLCVGCPALPGGVEAELTSLRQPSEEYMRTIKYGGMSHGRDADRLLSSQLIATFEVVASENPDISVEDSAKLLLTHRDIVHQEVRDAIEACSGPIEPSTLQRLLGKKAVCGGLPDYQVLPNQ